MSHMINTWKIGFDEGYKKASKEIIEDLKDINSSTFMDSKIFVMLGDRIKKWEKKLK